MLEYVKYSGKMNTKERSMSRRDILAVDLSQLLVPLPVDKSQLKEYLDSQAFLGMPPEPRILWLVCRLRALFDRVVFLYRSTDPELAQPYLFRWVEKHYLCVPGQEGDVVVLRSPTEVGEWCKEQRVNVLFTDSILTFQAVFSTSPETVSCLRRSQNFLSIVIMSLWDQSHGMLPQGKALALPNWEEFFNHFPTSRRA